MAPEPERDIVIEDESLAAGYTVIPNLILRNTALSPGAKLAYVMLLSYAWQDESCFPGQTTLARDMGVSERYVRNALKELAEACFITIEQRGLNRTNRYIIHRIGPARGADQGRQGSPGPAPRAGQGRHEKPVLDRRHVPPTKTQSKKTQKTMDVVRNEKDPSDNPNPPPHREPVSAPSQPFPIPELGLSSAQVWHALLDALTTRKTFPRSEIATWLRPAYLAGLDGDALLIAAPNAVARDRIEARMLPQLHTVAAERFGSPVTFRVVVA